MFLRRLRYLIFLFIFCSSCNRYVDTTRKEKIVPVMQGKFIFNPDSNLLFYKSNIGLKMDNVTLQPRSFAVKLPKKILFYELANSESFYFYYSDHQTILININLEDSLSNKDTSYVPSAMEISNLIRREVLSKAAKYNINKIERKNTRKQFVIKKSAATILLYNIKPENDPLFFDLLNGFQFK